MGFLVVGLVMVAALGLVNLAITLRMARQLRAYAGFFDGLEPDEVGGSTRPPGSGVGPFRALAVDGTPVDAAWFDEPTLVGFFSPGCSLCSALIPDFVREAAGRRALAVIEEGPEPLDEYVSALRDAATVIAGEPARPAVVAFGVRGYPAVCTVDGHGVITATGVHLVSAGHPVGSPRAVTA